MKKLYEKSEMTLTLILIAVYILSKSIAQPLNKAIGIASSADALFQIALTAILAVFIVKNGLQAKYGLCKISVPARKFLWFIPLALIASHNLWLGVSENLNGLDLACYLCWMLCVGFVEEILFRGMLFRAIEKDNRTQAMIISSVAFGLGHIVNMLNGLQSEWIVSISQIIFAIALGFLFVVIFDRGGSLWPCIIAHSAIDILSVFANEARISASPQLRLLMIGAIVVIILLYLLWLNRSLPRKSNQPEKATVS